MTTILAVKKDNQVAIAGDGQVTMGESVIFKNSATKVRRIYGGNVILGFAGSVSDAFSLSEKFEGMLNKFSGNLMRSAVELAELWRSDKAVSSDDCRRQRSNAYRVGYGRSNRTRRRHSRDRQRRQLCACRGARPLPEHRLHRRRNRAKVA